MSNDSGPPLFRCPTPSEIGARIARRLPAPSLSRENRHCLDTGVGIGFAAVKRVDLLESYLPERLMILQEVVIEVRRRASVEVHTAPTQQDERVNDACRKLRPALPRFPNVGLNEEFLDRRDFLLDRLKSKNDQAGHDGEAASLAWAESQRPRAIVLTNDGDAQDLADEIGVGWLNGSLVLAGMVDVDLISCDEALDLFKRMDAVSGIGGPTPTCPEWFLDNAQRSR